MVHPTIGIVTLAFSVCLLVLWWALVRHKKFSRRVIVWSFVAWVLIVGLYTAWVAADLFQLWNENPNCVRCQVHLPPYSNYWDEQSYVLYGKYFGLNALVGLLFGGVFWWFARRTGGQVIDRDDVFLLTLSGMMIGWPNILLFLTGLFLVGVIVFFTKRQLRHRVVNPRVIVTPFIPFVAVATVLWGDWLAKLLHIYDLGLVALTLQ